MLHLVAFQRAWWVISWVCIVSFLLLWANNRFVMAVGEAPTAVSIFISDEVSGTGLTARETVDTLNDSWETAGQTAGAASFTVGTINSTDTPVILTAGGGFTAEVSLRDIDGSDPLIGSPATTQGDASATTTTTTMQDNSPKPQSLYANSEAYYNESSGSSSNRNGLLFTFSSPVRMFGAWFGDVETRTDGQGTTAVLRLIDASGLQIGVDIPVPTSTIDQSLCGAPTNDSFAGCGNRTTRWIGFVADAGTPVKQMLLIVGDDDTTSGSDNGFTEHLSFIGAQVGVSPTAVSLTHLAVLPTTPTPWLLLVVLLGLLGLTARLVRRGV